MNITEVLHKRVLINVIERYYGNKITEVKFLEISPSGNWVKIMNMNGNKYWKPVTEISIVEVLKDLKPKKQDV